MVVQVCCIDDADDNSNSNDSDFCDHYGNGNDHNYGKKSRRKGTWMFETPNPSSKVPIASGETSNAFASLSGGFYKVT